MINNLIKEAYKILDGSKLSKVHAEALSKLTGTDIMDLISLANKVKNKFRPATHICTITNAKSGKCSNDCTFCAQSVKHDTKIETYPLAHKEEILQEAAKANVNRVKNFGIVTSGNGYTYKSSEFEEIIDSIDLIHKEIPDMHVCASLGILKEREVKALAAAGIKHYNINLQVNPAKYEKLISTTHDINDRIETVLLLQKYGIKTCVGGIIGVGETMEDRLELAFSLKNLNVDVIPLNVLIPIPGTPLEKQEPVPVSEIAKTFALFRLINPKKIIKFAAGRETVMKDFQGLLMLSGANGMLTGGYLTTRGRSQAEDVLFEKNLGGFNV